MKGRAIIKGVLRRSNVGPKDFFSPSRLPHVVQARRTAVVALKEAGLTKNAIGHLLGRDHSTVSYHLKKSAEVRA